MTIRELGELEKMETVFATNPELRVTSAYTSDLLSDVMARAEQDCVLITIQAHRNTIAVAAMVGARAVVVCNQRDVPSEMIEAAREDDIAILRTRENQFQTSCRVHELLLKTP